MTTFLDALGTGNSSDRGVSADGSVVVGDSSGQAFRWESGVTTGLGDLPDGGPGSQARGVSADGSVVAGVANPEAFRWTETHGMIGLGDLPGSDFVSRGFGGVSADGSTVVGESHSTVGPGGEAFRWTEADGMLGLGVAGTAWDSSADGSVIVGRGSIGGAWIWDDTNGVRLIRDILEANGLDLAGWWLSEATEISDDGRIVVGEGINPDGNKEAWRAEADFASIGPGPAIIPEPSAFIVWGLMGLTLGIACRRRRRVNQK